MMVQFDVKRVQSGSESFMVSFDFNKTPVTQIADYIIIAAAKHGTSDIHFDPRDEGMMVRFRIDGDCQDYTFIPKAYERNLTTRLKLLANMNITETRLPQDGSIKGNFGETYLDMRVSCLPTNEGEKIVIRILDYTRSLQGIDSLGFNPKNLEKIKHMMNVPNGIILVTGATGSGKSTTTYSMLSGLNKTETNVITVEDPVEMNIEGINQVQVNSEIGMTFAAALRSILRQDPNVILIGEIRDSETAQIAVRASITGHLVLSTLHTNNALSTIERLLDMNVERYLLSTALTGIISQRLAKQLCSDCRKQRQATQYEKKIFKNFLHEDIDVIWDANPKGCEHCRKGYRGRIAIHEVLLLDEKIRTALNNEKLKKEELIKMVYTGNTITMLQDALLKVLEGYTSFEEVYKNIEIENEDEENYINNITEVEENEPTEEYSNEDDLSIDEQSPIKETPTVFEESQTEESFQIPEINNNQQSEITEESTQQEPTQTINTESNNNISKESKSNEFDLGYKIVMPEEDNEISIFQNTFNDTKQPENNTDDIPDTTNIESSQEIYEVPLTNEYELEQDNNIIENTIIEIPTFGTEEQKSEEENTNNDLQDDDPIIPTIEIKNNLAESSNNTKTIVEEKLSEEMEPEEEQVIYNSNIQANYINENAVEKPIPNIQALSVISEVTDNEITENNTGSQLLNDPGIRIADDGSINKTAEINAEPILPNIETN